MLTIEEIRAMSPEEQAVMQSALGRKIVINKIILPVALAVGFRILFNKLDSKS
jgi:hypothetical protein